MAIKGKQYLLSIILFSFFSFTISAQVKNEKQSLIAIFEAIQNQYNYQFNYAEDSIESVYIIPPKKELTLEDVLRYLERNTPFSFTIISDNIILVKQKEGFVICGYIKDIETQSVLTSATIQSNTSSTVSDNNGFFQLLVKSESELISIKYLGFKTVTKLASVFNKEVCLDTYLYPSFQLLSEVIISNYMISGINKLSDGSFEIDFSNFEILPGVVDADVLQSVQAFPGIQSINETVSNINIRGGTHDQNLILWDGIKMYQSGHFFGLISMYNPQITDKVSLQKNGSNVIYTDGVSGTIAMKTDNEINSKFRASLGGNFIDANAFADVPISEKSSIQFAARKSISDFLKTPTYTNFFERISQNTEVDNNTNNSVNSDKEFDFYDTSLRWLYQISDKDVLRVNFINVSNELIFNENAIINSNQESRESSLKQNSIAGAVFYNRVWNDKFQTSIEVYETDYKLKAINANILDEQRFLQENSVSESSLKLTSNYRITEQLNLLSGLHFVETEVTNLDDVDNPLYRLKISEVVRLYSAFSQIGFVSKNRNTAFNIGTRFNYLDKFKKSILEPRFSFNQKFLNDFRFEILGEFKHQYTSQVVNLQNDFLGIEKRRWQLSNNEEIPVITSKQLSTGISFSKKGWLLSLEGYYKMVDGITSQSQGFQNQYRFSNVSGSYDVKGIDFLFRKGIGSFSGWLSYSFMDNTYKFNSLDEPSFPSNYNITHALTLGTAYTKNRFKVSAGFNWHSGKPTTEPIFGNEIVNNEVNFGAANNQSLEDYLRLDISAIYDLKFCHHVNATIGLSVWNVLDKENIINSFYSVQDQNLLKTNQQSLAITPNAFIRVYF